MANHNKGDEIIPRDVCNVEDTIVCRDEKIRAHWRLGCMVLHKTCRENVWFHKFPQIMKH